MKAATLKLILGFALILVPSVRADLILHSNNDTPRAIDRTDLRGLGDFTQTYEVVQDSDIKVVNRLLQLSRAEQRAILLSQPSQLASAELTLSSLEPKTFKTNRHLKSLSLLMTQVKAKDHFTTQFSKDNEKALEGSRAISFFSEDYLKSRKFRLAREVERLGKMRQGDLRKFNGVELYYQLRDELRTVENALYEKTGGQTSRKNSKRVYGPVPDRKYAERNDPRKIAGSLLDRADDFFGDKQVPIQTELRTLSSAQRARVNQELRSALEGMQSSLKRETADFKRYGGLSFGQHAQKRIEGLKKGIQDTEKILVAFENLDQAEIDEKDKVNGWVLRNFDSARGKEWLKKNIRYLSDDQQAKLYNLLSVKKDQIGDARNYEGALETIVTEFLRRKDSEAFGVAPNGKNGLKKPISQMTKEELRSVIKDTRLDTLGTLGKYLGQSAYATRAQFGRHANFDDVFKKVAGNLTGAADALYKERAKYVGEQIGVEFDAKKSRFLFEERSERFTISEIRKHKEKYIELFGEKNVELLLDPKRKETVNVGSHVFGPPGIRGTFDDEQMTVYSVEQYYAAVERRMNLLNKDLVDMMLSSKDKNKWWLWLGSTKHIIQQVEGRINYHGRDRDILNHIAALKDLGLPDELIEQSFARLEGVRGQDAAAIRNNWQMIARGTAFVAATVLTGGVALGVAGPLMTAAAVGGAVGATIGGGIGGGMNTLQQLDAWRLGEQDGIRIKDILGAAIDGASVGYIAGAAFGYGSVAAPTATRLIGAGAGLYFGKHEMENAMSAFYDKRYATGVGHIFNSALSIYGTRQSLNLGRPNRIPSDAELYAGIPKGQEPADLALVRQGLGREPTVAEYKAITAAHNRPGFRAVKPSDPKLTYSQKKVRLNDLREVGTISPDQRAALFQNGAVGKIRAERFSNSTTPSLRDTLGYIWNRVRRNSVKAEDAPEVVKVAEAPEINTGVNKVTDRVVIKHDLPEIEAPTTGTKKVAKVEKPAKRRINATEKHTSKPKERVEDTPEIDTGVEPVKQLPDDFHPVKRADSGDDFTIVTEENLLPTDSLKSAAGDLKIESMTSFQEKTLSRAHLIGKGQPGRDGTPAGIRPDGKTNYTQRQLGLKMRELQKIDPETGKPAFTKEQAKTLIRKGHAGEPVVWRAHPDGYIVRTDTKRDVSAPAADMLTRNNVQKLVDFEYRGAPEGVTGAKGIVYRDVDGNLKVRFWSTGQGRTGNNIHHRDGLATILQEQSDVLVGRALQTGDEALFTRAAELEQMSLSIRGGSRKQLDMANELLDISQGFQVSMKMVDGKPKIVHLDIDSSITKTQIARGHEVKGKVLSDQIVAIQNSIAPELRGYTRVRVAGYENMKIKGDVELPGELEIGGLY